MEFSGKIVEYGEVSIDGFDDVNLDSTVYLLSHCHMDHMSGLGSQALLDRLTNLPFIRIYASAVTIDLVKAMPKFAPTVPYFYPLTVDECSIVPVCGDTGEVKYNLSVTPLPAGHCPGSVMFLLEGPAARVLYTGDFRINVGDTPRLRTLFRTNGQLRQPIDSVYVDTTFCVPNLPSLPTRSVCADLVLKMCIDWFKDEQANPANPRCVHISTNYDFGYEFLLIILASYFKCKIHATQLQYDKYKYTNCMSNILTTSFDTKLHFCRQGKNRFCSSLPDGCESNVLTIAPSALRFAKMSSGAASCSKAVDNVEYVNKNFIRVLYSSHASLEEVVDFLKHIRPKTLFANVEPVNCDLKAIEQKLRQILSQEPELGSTQLHVRSPALEDNQPMFSFSKARKRPRFNFDEAV